MALLKVIFIVAITMALSIAVTMKSIVEDQKSKTALVHVDFPSEERLVKYHKKILVPSKRMSRFLAENVKARNPNAADHCHKDNEVCHLSEAKNSTCCNNKCVDLAYDDKHCGACKRKCQYTETCCRGECVDLNYDKRHCGYCNHRCEPGEYCVYGLCNYA